MNDLPRAAEPRNGPYGYLEASVLPEGPACPLAVNALVSTTALASKDWRVGLLYPPIQCLTSGNKFPESPKGFAHSPGTKRQKGNEQKNADYV